MRIAGRQDGMTPATRPRRTSYATHAQRGRDDCPTARRRDWAAKGLVRDGVATGGDGGASATRRRCDRGGRWRAGCGGVARGERIGAEGIGEPRRMQFERTAPRIVKRRAGEAVAQRMRAGPRHARGTRGPCDAAGFHKRGEEDTLFGRGPVRAGEWGLLGHPTG